MIEKIPPLFLVLAGLGVLLVGPAVVLAVTWRGPAAGFLTLAGFLIYFCTLYIVIIRRSAG